MKITILSILVALTVCSSLRADWPDDDKVLAPGSRFLLIGPYGGIDYNIHHGIFSTSEGQLVCCTFDGGTGIGAVFGIKAMIPVSESICISPRILYENKCGTFDAQPQTYPILGKGNVVEPLVFQNQLEVSIHSLSIDVLGTYTIGETGLYVAVGPSASFELTNKYVQTESISSPSGVRYLNGGTSQTVLNASMDITNKATLSLRGGLGMSVQLVPGISLNPEVLYTIPTGNISKSGIQSDWSVNTLQATIGILFTL